jgi:hypothetical protein
VNSDDLRRLALALPEAEEKSHFDKPDFRVRGTIFASLKNPRIAVVKLTREQQEVMAAAEPEIFSAVAGGWGVKGWTEIYLEFADEPALKSALVSAWRNVVPKVMLKLLG